jgi:hypothetical protein
VLQVRLGLLPKENSSIIIKKLIVYKLLVLIYLVLNKNNKLSKFKYKKILDFYRTFTVLNADGVDRYGAKYTP